MKKFYDRIPNRKYLSYFAMWIGTPVFIFLIFQDKLNGTEMFLLLSVSYLYSRVMYLQDLLEEVAKDTNESKTEKTPRERMFGKDQIRNDGESE